MPLGIGGPLANLVVNIMANTQQFNTQLNSVRNQLTHIQSTSNRLTIFNPRPQGFLNSFFAITTGIYALKQYISLLERIETGFVRIERVAKEFKGGNFRNQIFDLAQNISGTGIEDIQHILKISAQLGIRGKKDLLEFSNAIAMMSGVTGQSAEALATDIGKIIQVFSLLPRDAERVSNTILQVADDLNAQELEITNIARRIGAFASSIGLSMEQTVAFAGAMKDVGVNTEIAASSLYTFFARLQTNPTKIAKLFGYNTEEEIFNFFKRLRNEPVEAITVLLEKIKALSPGEKLLFFKELELYGVRNAAALGTLAEKVERLKEALDSANKGSKENVKLLINQWDRAHSLAGKIDDMSDSWKRFVDVFSNTALIGGAFNFISNSLDAITNQLREINGLKLDIDVDFSDINSIKAREAQLGRQIREMDQARNLNANPVARWVKSNAPTFVRDYLMAYMRLGTDIEGRSKLIRERSMLNRIIQRMEKQDEEKKKEPIPEAELRREFNIIRSAEDEKKGRGRQDQFRGFMDLTEAWKNLILDRMEGKDRSFEALQDIHQEAAEINAGVDDVASILRSRTFPAVLA